MRRLTKTKLLYELAASGFELSEIGELGMLDRFWLTPKDVRFLESCGIRVDPEDILAEVCKQKEGALAEIEAH